ncbi:hypothetical protein [Lysobacter sp. F60174L2]|uniref:hypothetical protein n=1 Tax=Lysobacter sp. F60174L2 TaxID=3459295 RepID=UPI00403D84A1
MSINIQKVADGYLAQVTPPHGGDSAWEATEPLAIDALIKKLLALGCHQTDIGDAFYQADPHWLEQE